MTITRRLYADNVRLFTVQLSLFYKMRTSLVKLHMFDGVVVSYFYFHMVLFFFSSFSWFHRLKNSYVHWTVCVCWYLYYSSCSWMGRGERLSLRFIAVEQGQWMNDFRRKPKKKSLECFENLGCVVRWSTVNYHLFHFHFKIELPRPNSTVPAWVYIFFFVFAWFFFSAHLDSSYQPTHIHLHMYIYCRS